MYDAGTNSLPNPSEIKILRDEMARVIADLKKRDRIIDGMDAKLRQLGIEHESLRIENGRLRIENERLRAKFNEDSRKMSYYENPHSPPSQNSIPTKQKKSESRKDPSQYKKPGQSRRGTFPTTALDKTVIDGQTGEKYDVR